MSRVPESIFVLNENRTESWRGAMFLARAMKKANNCNIFEKAKKFGIKIVLIEEMKLQIKSTSRREATVTHTSSIEEIPPVVKVRRLKEPFIKVVDRSESYRPLVLEMKEWPDALTMFSQGTNILQDAGIKKGKRKITFCELCNVSFTDLQTHLDSRKHINNASDAKNWAGVDVIYQTRERVFHQDIQTPRSGVWIPDETLFRVFDMASQTIHNSWRNSKQKFAKPSAN